MTAAQPNDPHPEHHPQDPPHSDHPDKGSNPHKEKAADYVAHKRESLQRERPPYVSGKPPELDADDFSTSGPRMRDLDREIEEEMAAALAGLDDQDLYGEKPGGQSSSTPGGKQKGKVVSIHSGDVFIDIPGGRSQGVMSLLQFEEGRPEIGSMVDFTIERYDPANGLLILSRKGAAVAVDWSSVARGQIVEARVTGTNRGGLSVEVNQIRGFMPISQIDMYRVEQPEQFLNQRLRCVVTEVDPVEKNLVVSRRELLEREREEKQRKFWETIEEDATLEGIVRSVKPFGVFVDLGGADGLVPVSEMSWARVADPSQLVAVGQKVQVKVLRLDREARKITLSLRHLSPSPWDTARLKYAPGTNVEGKVTRIADFGAFVELEPGLEGLVHVSELSTQRVRKPRDVVQEQQLVTVQVLGIDEDQRRIALSLKAVQAEKEAAQAESDAEEEAPPATPRTPKINPANLRGGLNPRG